MNTDELPTTEQIEARKAGTVTDRCETKDAKGHRCGLATHKGRIHMRYAQPNELAFYPGQNSIITWTDATG